ncbi:MAG TPA: 2-hydroxychromene-2-carboxylate isomerase [Anaeromyxobacteraceae bacterium]|nr:2-hydroxychromene-2-carboxylate isomerase [Anaeromyxobacteraceae bacterium]
MPTLEFFYDFVSPYSYLASTRVEAVAARTGAALRWRPFLLGGVLKATGNRAPIETVAKGRHMWIDLERWARRLDVPFRRPTTFPFSSILALRTALAVPAADLPRATHALFRAAWADGRDVADPAVLRRVLEEAGLDGAALVEAAPGQKEALAAQTQEAVDRGTYGAPTFLVGPELFVGNDRLDFVEEALRSPR